MKTTFEGRALSSQTRPTTSKSRWAKRIGVAVVLLLIAIVGLAWLTLSSSIMKGPRVALTESVLSDALKSPMHINDDVSISIGKRSLIQISQVVIPNPDGKDGDLVTLDYAQLSLDVPSLLKGKIDLGDLEIDGLTVAFRVGEDGEQSWARENAREKGEDANEQNADESEEDNSGLLDFAVENSADISNINLIYENNKTGWSFDFALERFDVAEISDRPGTQIASSGSVNGEAFAINGAFPTGEPFDVKANFGSVTSTFVGQANPEGVDGVTARLDFEMSSIGDFLDVIQIDRAFEGSGKIGADLNGNFSRLSVQNLEALVALEEGQSLTITGAADDIWSGEALDLTFVTDLVKRNEQIARATKLKEFRLTEISGNLLDTGDNFELKDLLIETNAFEENLQSIGPIGIGRFRRTKEGKLALREVTVQAGPIDDPFIRAEGDIKDLLQLKDLAFEGVMSTSAKAVLKGLPEHQAEKFGRVNADFALNDDPGYLTLSKLHATTVDTDLWALQMDMSMGNIQQLSELTFALGIEIPEGSSFLEALELDPVDVGKIAFSGEIQGSGIDSSIKGDFQVGGSHIETDLKTGLVNERPNITGTIGAETVNVEDFVNLGHFAKELASLAPEKPEETPLETEEELAATEEDNHSPLETFDADIRIEVAEIVGQKGVNSLASDLVLLEGVLKFGPLDLHYGSGRLKIDVGMDVSEDGYLIGAQGSAYGWSLAQIMNEIQPGLPLEGTIGASFNVRGDRRSVRNFTNSMSGDVNLALDNGKIGTSLIELPGLGITRWLFSETLRQGYANITCIRVPLRLSGGSATTNAAVIDTDRVQILAAGLVDWKNDEISLRAEPRPLGRPKAASPIPVQVTGKLSDPKISLPGRVPSEEDNILQNLFGAPVDPATVEPCKIEQVATE